MWIGVLSDSHGDTGQAAKAVRAMGSVDLVVHAGDFYQDALYLEERFGIEVKKVVGNCDRGAPGPWEELLELGGQRIYLTHGHLFGVKQGLLRLDYRAREVGAGMVIFGHTHMPQNEVVNGIRYLNPGSVSCPRVRGQYTYALVKLGPGTASVDVFNLA